MPPPSRFVAYSSFDYEPTYYPSSYLSPLFTHAASSIGYTHSSSIPPTSILDCTLRLIYPHIIHWNIAPTSSSIYILAVFIDVVVCRMLQWPMITLADSFQCISVCAYFIQPHLWSLFYPPPHTTYYRNGYYYNNPIYKLSLYNSIQFAILISADNIRTCLLDI